MRDEIPRHTSTSEHDEQRKRQLQRIADIAFELQRAAANGDIVGVWVRFDALEREVIASGKPESAGAK